MLDVDVIEITHERSRTLQVIVSDSDGSLVLRRREGFGLVIAALDPVSREVVAVWELREHDAQRFADRIGAMMDGE